MVGQDLEQAADGTWRIARRVAPDRVISTVDPRGPPRHKTLARGFDGYKGHIAMDPDSEIITHAVVSPADGGDASVAEDLVDDLVADAASAAPAEGADHDTPVCGAGEPAFTAGPGRGGQEGPRVDAGPARPARMQPALVGSSARKAARQAKLRRRDKRAGGTGSDRPTV